MFDSRVRRHPVQTFQFWFVVLTCFVGATAWKLDLFRLSGPPAPIAAITEEPMPPPPLSGEESLPARAEFTLAESTPPTVSPDHSVESDPAEAPSEAAPEVLLTGTIEAAPLQVESENRAPPEQMESGIVQTAALQKEQLPSSGVVTANLQATHPEASSEQKRERTNPAALSSVEILTIIEDVDQLLQAGEDIRAHRLLSETYWKARGVRPQLMSRLNLLAHRIYFSADVHYLAPYEVRFGDRLENLAAQNRVSVEYLARLNHLESSTLKVGQSLKVLQGPFSAVIDPDEFVMTIHSQGYFVIAVPIGFGGDQPIPVGTFRVTKSASAPDGRAAASIRGLTIENLNGSVQGYRLQPTTEQNLLGAVAGRGGLRMGSREFELVYDLLTENSELIINPHRQID